MKKQYKKFSKGFTFIETIISLFTIGILAVLVLPSIVHSGDEKILVTKLQKMHTELELIYQKTVTAHGASERWNASSTSGLLPINYFTENMEVLKDCETTTNCPSSRSYISLDGTVFGKAFSANINNGCVILGNGSFLCISSFRNSCTTSKEGINNICGSIYIDLNGKKSPNRFGIDTFLFYYTQERIIPCGMNSSNLVMLCNKNYSYKINGLGCTSWALENGNMEYLRNKIH